jgi:DNA polymerase I-like protein with 3'-5' exonuclease and polymerase domains
MNRVVLDFETYYDRDYSLTKLTTEEYIRDERFEAIGVAIKINDEPAQWYPQMHIEKGLRTVDWENSLVIGQNMMFDAAILAWRFNRKARAWGDTLGMSRALFPHDKAHGLAAQAKRHSIGMKGDEVINALGKRHKDFTEEQLARYGEYCINDVELTTKLFDLYATDYKFPVGEMKLIDATLRMFVEPKLVLDAPLLREYVVEVRETQEALLAAVNVDRAQFMSNKQFAELLREYGVEPPTKISLTTGKETYAFAKTDEDFKRLMEEHPDPRVNALVAARLGVKSTIEETRAERFLQMSNRGAFPVPLRYYGAHSGRWSGQDKVNLQNLPARDPTKNTLKRAIKAPPGYVIIDCDSSQIEARTLAWLAGQMDLVDAFANKQDVYRIMAAQIYGVAPDQVDKTQRQVGKTVILGAGYGVGHAKLRLFLKTGAKVEVSEEEAKRIIDTYRRTYYRIPELWKRADTALAMLAAQMPMPVDAQQLVHVVPGKGLSLPSGLHIQYPDLRQFADEEGQLRWHYTSRGRIVAVYGGKCVENFTQAVARCVVGEQMLRIAKRYTPVLTVHDAVACIAPEEEAEEAQRYVEECMSWRPRWAGTLPLACEAGRGASYGGC